MSRFAKLTYEDFKRLAADDSLTPYQRIGFPDSYREGFEPAIVADMIAKVPPLQAQGGVMIDIGCGCSDLPRLLAAHGERLGQQLVFIDSAEMLDRVQAGPHVRKVPGKFPAMPALVEEFRGRATAVIAYSVLHYVFEGEDLFGFLDAACGLLAPGGHLLLGDLPNVSKRRRFFASETGVAFHKAFMKTEQPPVVEPYALEPARIDDGVVFGILMRYRAAGFDAYVLPQGPALPLRNRREDLLIVRP
ncbi:MAG: class I SAM-dependent methyltransferase [Myxococcales bacterium]|nr:class I SAM-dependent methyltransferase [Myxococcales bacterium]